MAKKKTCRVPPDSVPKETTQKPKMNHAEADIDQAVERVYRMYGPDLSAFFNAVEQQQQIERHEKHNQGGPLRTSR
jgi:hypothetical protein